MNRQRRLSFRVIYEESFMSFTRKFYTSDCHFGHHGILSHCPTTRPFSSVEEMDSAILNAINERVEKSDIIYILGDFSVGASTEYVAHVFHEIRCRKVLVLGNHDLDKKGRVLRSLSELSWDVPPTHAITIKDDDQLVHLSHYAHRVWQGSNRGSYHLFGHSHGTLPSQGRSLDVGLDAPDMDFQPKTFSEIRDLLHD
jgi:calcineurin-like phosphoesterase family protein